MSNRTFIAVAAVLALLIAGAGGLYAYDRSGRDTVARGVSVAGIDVGGLSAAQARARLERRYLAPLRRPIVVHHAASRFVLGARESRLAVDLGGMVDEALAAGRTGNLASRTWRRLTGGRVSADVAPRATFAKSAAVRLVDRVRAAIDRKAKDADVSFSASGPAMVTSHDGLAVAAHELHSEIDRAIVDPRARRTLVAHTRKVEPKVSTSQLTSRYGTVVIVDRGAFQLRLYKSLRLVKSYPIAVGKIGLETPSGLYHIQNKAINPAWTKPNSDWIAENERGKVVPGGTSDNPLKARWLGIYAGAGIHGIDPSEYGTIGHAASHGCVRMRIADVEELYPEVPVGAPIYIA